MNKHIKIGLSVIVGLLGVNLQGMEPEKPNKSNYLSDEFREIEIISTKDKQVKQKGLDGRIIDTFIHKRSSLPNLLKIFPFLIQIGDCVDHTADPACRKDKSTRKKNLFVVFSYDSFTNKGSFDVMRVNGKDKLALVRKIDFPGGLRQIFRNPIRGFSYNEDYIIVIHSRLIDYNKAQLVLGIFSLKSGKIVIEKDLGALDLSFHLYEKLKKSSIALLPGNDNHDLLFFNIGNELFFYALEKNNDEIELRLLKHIVREKYALEKNNDEIELRLLKHIVREKDDEVITSVLSLPDQGSVIIAVRNVGAGKLGKGGPLYLEKYSFYEETIERKKILSHVPCEYDPIDLYLKDNMILVNNKYSKDPLIVCSTCGGKICILSLAQEGIANQVGLVQIENNSSYKNPKGYINSNFILSITSFPDSPWIACASYDKASHDKFIYFINTQDIHQNYIYGGFCYEKNPPISIYGPLRSIYGVKGNRLLVTFEDGTVKLLRFTMASC